MGLNEVDGIWFLTLFAFQYAILIMLCEFVFIN